LAQLLKIASAHSNHESDQMKRILFVCLGNICRSPLAEGLFGHHVANSVNAGKIAADSAGTSNWHVGSPPHDASIRIARARGIELGSQKCRQVGIADFSRFDVILGMDADNLDTLFAMQRNHGGVAEVGLFLDYAGLGKRNVPDPWGKSDHAYEQVADMISEACPNILRRLLQG
jgi:protein-tyrosine phosphatase